MNVTEEVTIHRPNVSTLLSSAFIRGDLNAATRGPFICFYISSKPFWNFVQSKRKVKCDLASLKVNDSYLNDDLSTANCMNSYFSSAFPVEGHENFPDLEYITDEKLCNIFCSTKEVEKLLRNKSIL